MNFITGDSVPVPVGSASAIPSSDNRYDIGSSTKRWRDGRFVNLYTGSTDVGGELTSLGATKLSLTGGALTGQVTTNQTPVSATQLVHKGYVDTTISPINVSLTSTKNVLNSVYSNVGGTGMRDTWAVGTGGVAGNLSTIAVNSVTGMVVISTSVGLSYSSNYGETYTDVASSISTAGVIWVSQLNLFVAKSSTQAQTSSDGITWSAPVSAITTSSFGLNRFVYAFGLIVARDGSTAGKGIKTSPDGITWTLQTMSRGVESIVFVSGKLMTFSTNGSMTSVDGINWVNDAFTTSVKIAVYAPSLGTIFAIPYNTTSLMTSTDAGVSWTTRTGYFPSACTGDVSVWDDVNSLCSVFQESGAACVMFQFDGYVNASMTSLARAGGISGSGPNGPFTVSYIQSRKRFLVGRNVAGVKPYYSTPSSVATGMLDFNVAVDTPFIVGGFIFKVLSPYGLVFIKNNNCVLVNGSITTIWGSSFYFVLYSGVVPSATVYTTNSLSGAVVAGQTFKLMLVDETNSVTYKLEVVMRTGATNATVSARMH